MNEKQSRLPALGDCYAAKIRNAPPLRLTPEEKKAALQRIELQEQSFDERLAEVTPAESRTTQIARSQQVAAQGFIKLAEQRGQTVAQWVRDVAEAELPSYESTEDMVARQQALLDEVTQHVAEEEVRLLKSQRVARRDPNLIELSPGVLTLRPGAIEEYEDRLIEQKRQAAVRDDLVWVPISRKQETADVSHIPSLRHISRITRPITRPSLKARLWRWLVS